MPEDNKLITPHPVIDSQVQAYNNHNLDAFCAHYQDDASLYLHPSGELLVQGQAGLRQRYAKSFAIPGLRVVIASRLLVGTLVIDEELIYTDENPDLPRRAVLIYEVADGLIRRAWICRDDPG